MSFIEPSFVQVVAEGLGIKPSEDAANILAPEVENRLSEIVQEASKFARHAKRTYLTPEDVNNAFKLRNVEPVYGMSGSTDPTRFVRAAGQVDVIYPEDPVIPLSTILETPLPDVPWEAGLTVHWLAVNGKRPAIPENTPLLPLSHRDKRQRTEAAQHPLPALVPPVHSPIPAQQQPGTGTAAGAPPAAAGTAGTAAPPPPPAAAAAPEEGALIRAPLRHLLSKELHLYYNKVSNTLERCPVHPDPPSKELLAVLTSLRTDAGLQPLAPYLAHLISEGVATHIASAPRLEILLRAAVGMGSNPLLDLGPYLHEIFPAVLTCLLSRSIGISGDNGGGTSAARSKEKKEKEREEEAALNPDALHWGLRDGAARAAAALCARYPDAAPRVQRQILAALTTAGASLPTRYGAVVGIEAQGPRAVRALLLPNLIPAVAALADDLAGKHGQRRMAAAVRVRGALLAAAGHCIYLSGIGARWGAAAQEASAVKAPRKAVSPAPSTATAEELKKKMNASTQVAKTDRKKRTPAVAKLTVQEAALLPSRPATASKLKRTTSTASRGVSRGKGARSKASAKSQQLQQIKENGTAVGEALPPLSEIFGEEVEEDPAVLAAAVETAHAWMQAAVHHGGMRPMNLGENERVAEKYSGSGARGSSLPSENYLAEAWREDFPVAKLHQAMEELFGDDLAPYEPDAPRNW